MGYWTLGQSMGTSERLSLMEKPLRQKPSSAAGRVRPMPNCLSWISESQKVNNLKQFFFETFTVCCFSFPRHVASSFQGVSSSGKQLGLLDLRSCLIKEVFKKFDRLPRGSEPKCLRVIQCTAIKFEGAYYFVCACFKETAPFGECQKSPQPTEILPGYVQLHTKGAIESKLLTQCCFDLETWCRNAARGDCDCHGAAWSCSIVDFPLAARSWAVVSCFYYEASVQVSGCSSARLAGAASSW